MSTIRPFSLADNVRAECVRRRVALADLAQVLSISRSSLHRRLTGEVAFDVDELQLLATHLGVTPASLLGGVSV